MRSAADSSHHSPAGIFHARLRRPPDGLTRCQRHSTQPAVATCFTCGQPTCERCTSGDFEGEQCVDCMARKRTQSRAKRVGTALAALVVGSVALATLPNVEIPFQYGMHRPKVRALEGVWVQDPCHQGTTLELVETVLAAGNPAGAAAYAKAHLARCGEWPRLRAVLYEAHRRAHEFPEALAQVDALLASDPLDVDFRWWRGLAHEQAGQANLAVEDYQQALWLAPHLGVVPRRLAHVKQSLDEPCEALSAAELLLSSQPALERDVAVNRQLQTMRQACPQQDHALGSAVLQVAGDGRHVVDVAGGAGLPLSMVEHPDAAAVMVDAAGAQRLGVVVDATAPLRFLATPWGMVKARPGKAPLLVVGGARAVDVDVAVVDALPEGMPAILGASFTSRFARTVDSGPECAGTACVFLRERGTGSGVPRG